MEIFLGKSEPCLMTAISGSFNKKVFDGNTILLEISEENDKHRYLFFGGDMVCSFLTNDKIYKYISNMGNKLIPYSKALGEENIYSLTAYFEYVKKEKIHEVEDVNELFDYYQSGCGKDSFKKLRTYEILSNYD